MDELLDEVPPAARGLGSRVELQSPDQVHSRMKPKIDPKSNHHPRKSNPSHQIPIMEVDMSYIPIIMPWCFIILKSVHIFYSRRIMFWPVLSPWLNEVSVSRFARMKLHSREAWRLSTSIANYTFAFSFVKSFNAPMSMGSSPESHEVKMCLDLKYCTKVFVICWKVLIVAAFKHRCCWSAPEVSLIKVATSTLSGIGALASPVSQALKSCSKVCVLNFH